MNKRFRFGSVCALALTLVLWASAFPAIRAGLQAYAPASLAFWRFVVASVVLFIRAVLSGLRLPDKRDFPAIFLLGFLGIAVYHTALNFGEVTVSSGVASIIINSAPVFTAVLASAFLGERLNLGGWLGSGVSFAGVILLTLGKKQGLALQPGALLVLLAAVAYSIYVILQKPLLKRYSALELTTYAIWVGTLCLMIFAPGAVRNFLTAPRTITLTVIYLGIFPAAIAYVSWAYVLSNFAASKASSFLYLEPVLSFAIAWVWLGETPTMISIVGGLICLTGVVIIGISERLTNNRNPVFLKL